MSFLFTCTPEYWKTILSSHGSCGVDRSHGGRCCKYRVKNRTVEFLRDFFLWRMKRRLSLLSSQRQNNAMPLSVSPSLDKDSIFCSSPGPGRLFIRRFDARRDSWERLTALLHRAFAPLASSGLHCRCADQDAGATRQRARAGECFVSVCSGQVVGTMTLVSHEPDSPCEHYRRDGVATLHQFAVSPAWQGRGVGRAMLAFAGRRAATHGAQQLALDTPFPANGLLEFYRAQGFMLVDVVRFPGRSYDSAVFSRPTVAGWPASPLTRRTSSSRTRR